MTMNSSGTGSMQSDINVTPMIDVLLVLLIIFMVIVPVASKGESATAPQPARVDVAPENPVVLEVLSGARGTVDFRINQQPVSRTELPGRLAAIFANRSQRVLFLKGDDQLAFTQIAEAIDISHAAGIERVGLMTPNAAQGH